MRQRITPMETTSRMVYIYYGNTTLKMLWLEEQRKSTWVSSQALQMPAEQQNAAVTESVSNWKNSVKSIQRCNWGSSPSTTFKSRSKGSAAASKSWWEKGNDRDKAHVTVICTTGDYLHFQLPEDCLNKMRLLYSPQKEAEHTVFTYFFFGFKKWVPLWFLPG